MTTSTANTYVLQFSSNAGHDMVWTDHVAITTTLDRDTVEKILDANPVVEYDEEAGDTAVAAAIVTWLAALHAVDPSATATTAEYVFATFAD